MKQTEKTDQTCSVMTINILGYVALCERLSGVNMMNFLNQHYFRPLHETIAENEGSIGPMIGDVQMAFWSLASGDRSTHRVCLTASQVLTTIERDQRELPPDRRFELAIGIATGEVLNLGNQVVGDVVNLSSRLCTSSRAYFTKVLVDSNTARLSPTSTFRQLDTVYIKGKGPLEIYELVDAS